MFPSLRGSFESRSWCSARPDGARVSIPQRKFRKQVGRKAWLHVGASFHPSEEVSKAHIPRPSRSRGAEFPSLRGSFESQNAQGLSLRARRFPSLRGSFESEVKALCIGDPRMFPSLRGSFERSIETVKARLTPEVSIPQRKFRKVSVVFTPRFRTHCFHPSEEVSKEVCPSTIFLSLRLVSIPQRKFRK